MVTHKQLFNRLILEQSDLISRKVELYQASAKRVLSRESFPVANYIIKAAPARTCSLQAWVELNFDQER